MAVITRWTPFTTTPIIGSTTYPEDIDTRNTEMASRMEEIDDMGQEMNGVADEVEADRLAVVADKNTVASNLVVTTSQAASASSDADKAESAADRAESAVPIGDSYNMTTVDAKDNRIVEANSSAYGYTQRVNKADRWLETDTPNVIVDKLGDDVRFSDGLYSRLGDEEVTNGDFSSAIGAEYTQESAGILTLDNGRGKLTSDGTHRKFAQAITTVVGKTYKLKVGYTKDTSPIAYIRVGTTTYGGEIHNEYYTGSQIVTANFTAESTTTYINFWNQAADAGQTSYFDNISVKEVPQAELPLAPFASGSTDELLDDAVNGVTTQSDHSVGDIIATGNNKMENGTFETVGDGEVGHDNEDGTVDGYTNTNCTVSISSNTLLLTGDGGNYPQTQYTMNVIDGESYTIRAKCKKGTASANAGIQVSDGVTPLTSSTSSTTFEYVYINIVANSNTWTLRPIIVGTSESGTAYFDDIEYWRTSNTIKQAVVATTAGDLVTNAAKFQTTDRAYRQDPILVLKTGITTIKGIHVFSAGASHDTIASAYGWSKIGNALYTGDLGSGTVEIIIIGLKPMLNDKGYHLFYNSKGWRKINSSVKQGLDTDAVRIYDCFIDTGTLTLGSASGRPDFRADGTTPKKAELVDFEDENGIIFKPPYSLQANEHDLQNSETNKLTSGDLEMSESCGVETLVRNQELASATQITIAVLNSEPEPVIGGSIYHNSLARRIESYVDDDTNWVMTLNSSMAIVVDTDIYYTSKANHNLTQGQAPTPDMIGDPDDYPSDWLSYLAGGNSIDANMLLINQDGTNAIPDNSVDQEFIFSKKVNSGYSRLWFDQTDWSGPFDTGLDNVANSYSGQIPATYAGVHSYTSQNNPVHFNDLTDYEMIIESGYIFASNTNDVLTDIAATINSVTGSISVGTDDTEKLSITKVIAGVITHTAETLTEDALVSFALFNNTTTKEYAIGCYFATDGVIDKADGAYIMNTGVFK